MIKAKSVCLDDFTFIRHLEASTMFYVKNWIVKYEEEYLLMKEINKIEYNLMEYLESI